MSSSNLMAIRGAVEDANRQIMAFHQKKTGLNAMTLDEIKKHSGDHHLPELQNVIEKYAHSSADMWDSAGRTPPYLAVLSENAAFTYVFYKVHRPLLEMYEVLCTKLKEITGQEWGCFDADEVTTLQTNEWPGASTPASTMPLTVMRQVVLHNKGRYPTEGEANEYVNEQKILHAQKKFTENHPTKERIGMYSKEDAV